MAQIEVSLPEHTVVPLMRLKESGMEIADLHVIAGSAAEGRAVRSLDLPPDTVISLVITDGVPRIPTGETVLAAGDEVIAVISQSSEAALRKLMSGPEQEA